MDEDSLTSLLLGLNQDLQRTIEDIRLRLQEEFDRRSIARLFDMGFGFTEFLVNMFLHLDMRDILNCRLVCSQWKEFIEKEVWWKHSGVRQDQMNFFYIDSVIVTLTVNVTITIYESLL